MDRVTHPQVLVLRLALRMHRDGQYEPGRINSLGRQRRSLQLLYTLERCGSPLTANASSTVDFA
jgi:hypothetical protein